MIRLHKLDYTAPTTVNEACSILDKHGVDARVLAGGTDLLPACKLRNTRPALLVSLNKIQGLKGIRVHDGGGLKIGAMTSLYEVRHDSSIIKHHGALAQAASCVGAMQHQHMGTLGGNLCLNTRCIYYNQSDTWRKSREVCFKMGGDVCHVVPKGRKCYAVFSGDTAPALIALDARVILMNGSGERIMPAGELYTGDGMEPNALKHNEILSEIRLPPPVGRQSSLYLKYRQREAIDFPLVGVAVRMGSDEDGVCTVCKVVLNAVGPAPIEIEGAGEIMKGKAPSDKLINQVAEKAVEGAHPVANTAGSTPSYRRKMAGILTRRALFAAASSLGLV